MSSLASNRILPICLLGIITSLLVVGVISATFARHVVQILPVALALAIAIWRPSWAVPTALPVFTFWLLVMIAIWLFLVGLARLVTGHFTIGEILCTLAIGACCCWGLGASVRKWTSTNLLARLLLIATFAALQFVALVLSMRPPFSR